MGANGGLIAKADLRVVKPLALSYQKLTFHHIVAGYLFGDGVFDLYTRIDLDKVEIIGVGIHEEFNRGGVVQADGPADGEGGVNDALTQAGVKIGRRSDLNDFLMPPLNRAIALEQMDQTAVLVAEQLNLNVTRAARRIFRGKRRWNRRRRRTRGEPDRARHRVCRPSAQRACRGRRRREPP